MRRLLCLALLAVFIENVFSVEWYASSPGGTMGDPLEGGDQPSQTGWSISVERDGETERRTLYRDGEFHSTVEYRWLDGRLLFREEKDREGQSLLRVNYAYDAEGNPRASYIQMGDGDADPVYVESDQPRSADSSLWRHSSGSGDAWRMVDREASGLEAKETRLLEGAVVEQSLWKYDEGLLEERVTDTGNEIRQSFYDDAGRLERESTTRDGVVILTRSYQWSEQELIRVEERGEGRLMIREIQWLDGRMLKETRTRDGVIVGKTEWSSPDERVETLFRNGEALVRVHWSGNLRIREEFLQDGQVAWEYEVTQ